MPRCPFATWKPISGSSGSYLGGPAKIVHHTTEGSTAAGAMSAYRANRSDPHFTVDATTIYQHIDTSFAARSLRNASGGVQTNRDSAIQIEVVGFAAKPKNLSTLANVAKLCRWIEANHGISKVWPNGFPKPSRNGRDDPGGHNRNAGNWDTKSGHYGHCHVPENDHWDPGYTSAEVALIMGSTAELQQLQEEWGFSIAPNETFNPNEPTELEINNIKLITYPVTVSLDNQGQGEIHLDIAAERVSSLIAEAVKLSDGRTWDICKVGLAKDEGRTLLVASGGKPNTEITVFVKVLETASLSETSTGCALDDNHEQIPSKDNQNHIVSPPIVEKIDNRDVGLHTPVAKPQNVTRQEFATWGDVRLSKLITPGSKGTPSEKSATAEKFLVSGKSSLRLNQKFRVLTGTRPETVIGEDNRQRIVSPEKYPWRMICSLEITGTQKAIGTGWFVGPKTIITAGHCVLDDFILGGWASEITVYPGRYGMAFPYPQSNNFRKPIIANRFETVQGWMNGRNPNYDYAVIHLDEPVGNETGWFSIAVKSDEELQDALVNVSGYPGDLQNGIYQYLDTNLIQSVTALRFFYSLDTYGGQSGAPAYLKTDDDQLQVIGIHTYGVGGSFAFNSATRITPDVFNTIKGWIAADT